MGLASSTTSRYATRYDLQSTAYKTINTELQKIGARLRLPDHAQLNRNRFPWSDGLQAAPEFYAARLWEYPWAIHAGELAPGLTCADLGCGQSPFTFYLAELGCKVTGFDQDIGTQREEDNFGVPQRLLHAGDVHFAQSDLTALEAPDASFDRVFCISVVEHISSRRQQARAMQEMARVLRPGGLAVVTVDCNLLQELTNPMWLMWASGLTPAGAVDLVPPRERFGIFFDGRQPADVFGFVLRKPDGHVKTRYGPEQVPLPAEIPVWQVPTVRDTFPPPTFQEDSALADATSYVAALESEMRGLEAYFNGRRLDRLALARRIVKDGYRFRNLQREKP